MDENEQQATLVIDFGDGVVGTFKANRYANQFLLIRHADDLDGDSGYNRLKAATVLALDQVLEEEHERLERFLYENGRNENYVTALLDGLGACWSGETGLPLEPSSDSSGDTSTPETDSSSTDGSLSVGTPAPAA